jgi:HD-GYP domain-containing protein (c-di-GMP phosphodiesterase class II)
MSDSFDLQASTTFVSLDALRAFVLRFVELKRETGHVLTEGVSQDLTAARMFISSMTKPGVLPEDAVQTLGKVEGLLEQALQRCRGLVDRLEGLDVNGRELGRVLDLARLATAQAQAIEAYDATLLSLARTVDARERETAGHSERVTRLACNLARRVDMPPEALVDFRRGAILHDIGKLGIPDAILLKSEPLDEAEWAMMRRHPELARDILGDIPYLARALDVPVAHHERWDGSGYPLGLRGEQIPLGACIFAVVDVWDGLLNDRFSREAWPVERAKDYIKNNSGVQFDPLVVEEFLEMIREEMKDEN